MKPSQFLIKCAAFHDAGKLVPPELRSKAPLGWHGYLALTLPSPFADAFSDGTLDDTRAMRFMLAAAIAKSEGE